MKTYVTFIELQADLDFANQTNQTNQTVYQAKPAAKRAAKPVKPVVKPAARPVKPLVKPAARPVKPVVKAVAKRAAKPQPIVEDIFMNFDHFG